MKVLIMTKLSLTQLVIFVKIFAMGVDGSMIETVLEKGGVYFNEEGKEQDVYQIMARNGVNFFRVRLLE